MRYSDQPTFRQSLWLAVKEVAPMLAFAYGVLAVIFVGSVLWMSPRIHYDLWLVTKLLLLIIGFITPIVWMGGVNEVYHRDTPMRREARERAQYARLRAKYE